MKPEHTELNVEYRLSIFKEIEYVVLTFDDYIKEYNWNEFKDRVINDKIVFIPKDLKYFNFKIKIIPVVNSDTIIKGEIIIKKDNNIIIKRKLRWTRLQNTQEIKNISYIKLPIQDIDLFTENNDDNLIFEKYENVILMERDSGTSGGSSIYLKSNFKKDPGGEVSLFYGTTREKLKSANLNEYYGSNYSLLQLGECKVTIPPGHKLGNIERPRKIFWFNLQKESKDKHITLKSIKELSEENFYSWTKEGIASSENKSSLIYIHGYNTTFTEAALRAGQIAYDIPFNGITGFFSWNSMGKVLSYLTDIENADLNSIILEKFIETFIEKTGVQHLHFIAHSMGNRILTRALNNLYAKESFKDKASTISQIILAAPDIDRDVFAETILPIFKNIGNRRTLYTSDKDKALILSKSLRNKIRLGEAGELIYLAEGLDTIDASNVMSEGNNHSYIFETKELLLDLYLLLTEDTPPGKRRLREVQKESLKYWLFKE